MSDMWGFDELLWGLHEEESSDEEQWDQPVDGQQWHVQRVDEDEYDQDEYDDDEYDQDSVDLCGDFSDDEEDEQPFEPEWAGGEMLDQQMAEQWIGDLYDEDDWDNEPIEDEDMIIDYFEESCNCPACVAQASSCKSLGAYAIDCALNPT